MNEFNCNLCKLSFSIELKAKRNMRCQVCHLKHERERRVEYLSNPLNYTIMCQYREEYALKNKDKIRERTKEYKDKNKEKGKEKE